MAAWPISSVVRSPQLTSRGGLLGLRGFPSELSPRRRELDHAFLLRCLGLEQAADSIRYQLLHRAASAILAAEEFFAPYAVMLVHSFSPSGKWFEDFAQFAEMFGKRPGIGGSRSRDALRQDRAISRVVQGRPAVSRRRRVGHVIRQEMSPFHPA
jgi:hypothetical protein